MFEQYGKGGPQPCKPFEALADYGKQGMRVVEVISEVSAGLVLPIAMNAINTIGEGFRVVQQQMSNGEWTESMIHQSRLHDK